MKLELVEVGPARGAAETVVVWLHGLGASGHDFEPLVPILGQVLDVSRTRFVFPHAPIRPVTINMGMRMPAWYDILTLDHTGVRESEPDIVASSQAVIELLDAEIAAGVASTNVLLVGFSQGGALALHVGNRYGNPLAGVIVLSAYQLRKDSLESEAAAANAETPMLFGHGRHDEVVPVWLGEAAYETVRARKGGKDVRFCVYAMGHEVCPDEIGDIAQFMAQRLPTLRPA